MQKVIVIGCPGSGKSRFSRRLAELTGLPLFHLDLFYHNADKTTVSREVFDSRLGSALSGGEWIIDGNYGRTMERRLAECDTVFLFDYPTEICLRGLDERRGKPRPDMPWVETEPDEEFVEYVRQFSQTGTPKIYERLAKCPNLSLAVFKSREETDAYLAELTSKI